MLPDRHSSVGCGRVESGSASEPDSKPSEVESESEAMSGTDRTKSAPDLAGPVVILVEPQLGENIGKAARAMGNFALSRLRLVNPRDGWPNVSAQRAAAGADHILD